MLFEGGLITLDANDFDLFGAYPGTILLLLDSALFSRPYGLVVLIGTPDWSL